MLRFLFHIIWECRLCKFVQCNYDACASICIIWFIILTRLVACPFMCTLYLLLALLCVAWCTSARLLIFLFPTSGAIQASNFCHVGMLDSCLFSAWTPKLQVPDTDYTRSFVELDSVTSRALVLSALNFPIICGSKRSDHPLPDWRLCQLRGLRTTGSMWLDLKGNCAIVKHLPSASIAKALYHDTRDCSVLWLVACTHALLPLRPFCYSAQSSHSSVERLRLSVFLLLLFLGGTLTVRTQRFGGYHCGP